MLHHELRKTMALSICSNAMHSLLRHPICGLNRYYDTLYLVYKNMDFISYKIYLFRCHTIIIAKSKEDTKLVISSDEAYQLKDLKTGHESDGNIETTSIDSTWKYRFCYNA